MQRARERAVDAQNKWRLQALQSGGPGSWLGNGDLTESSKCRENEKDIGTQRMRILITVQITGNCLFSFHLVGAVS